MVQYADGDCLGVEWRPRAQRAGPLQLTTIRRDRQTLCIGCDDESDPAKIENAVVRYWQLFELPGYECAAGDADEHVVLFIRYVCYCLDLLYLTPTGRTLLTELLGECAVQNRRVLIDPGNSNQYRVSGSSMCSVAIGMRSTATGIPQQVKDALERARPNQTPRERLTWLWQRVSVAAVASNHGYVSLQGVVPSANVPPADVLQMQSEQQIVANAMTTLDETGFLAWLVSRRPDALGRYPSDPVRRRVDEHLRTSVILTLYRYATPSAGADVAVDFMAGPDADDAESGRRVAAYRRPPALGLAHELIHALYSVRGMQPDLADTNIVLTEMVCIGAGPFANFPIYENRIRSEWMVGDAGRAAARLATDAINQREHPLQRPYYAWDESDYLEQELRRNPRFRPFRWGGSASEGLVCSYCGDTHGSRRSTALGRWHRCTGCRDVYCNLCGKWLLERSSYLARTRACDSCGKETKLIE